MNPTISSKDKILQLITDSGGITAKQMGLELQISEVTLFKHLGRLINQGQVQKIGKVPKVVYIPNTITLVPHSPEDTKLDPQITEFINHNYLHITAEGRVLEGLVGFVHWCTKQGLGLEKTAQEYFQTAQKYTQYKSHNLIDGSFKLQESFGGDTSLSGLYYLDFYALERFGKTKLAQLTFQAKQSQDKVMIKQIVDLVRSDILATIIQLQIDAVGFVPPTVDRKVQFQTALKDGLSLPLRHLNILKLVIDTPVQQKSLKSKQERVLNASSTIFVDDNRKFENVLLIDDFVGSGSTLNETSKKIRNKHLATNVYGLALTGSFKGFEVINQV